MDPGHQYERPSLLSWRAGFSADHSHECFGCAICGPKSSGGGIEKCDICGFPGEMEGGEMWFCRGCHDKYGDFCTFGGDLCDEHSRKVFKFTFTKKHDKLDGKILVDLLILESLLQMNEPSKFMEISAILSLMGRESIGDCKVLAGRVQNLFSRRDIFDEKYMLDEPISVALEKIIDILTTKHYTNIGNRISFDDNGLPFECDPEKPPNQPTRIPAYQSRRDTNEEESIRTLPSMKEELEKLRTFREASKDRLVIAKLIPDYLKALEDSLPKNQTLEIIDESIIENDIKHVELIVKNIDTRLKSLKKALESGEISKNIISTSFLNGPALATLDLDVSSAIMLYFFMISGKGFRNGTSSAIMKDDTGSNILEKSFEKPIMGADVSHDTIGLCLNCFKEHYKKTYRHCTKCRAYVKTEKGVCIGCGTDLTVPVFKGTTDDGDGQ